MRLVTISTSALFSVSLLGSFDLAAQTKPTWTADEQPIVDQLRTLRKVPDETRGAVTRDLALKIRQLPASPHKLSLAEGLAGLSTEGDFGKDTLQEVADTLAGILREQPQPDTKEGGPASGYVTLAQLDRYEHIHTSLDAPPLHAAFAKLAADDERRASADFTLEDLNGKDWQLRSLRGKVVLVNFWATWCPPCRKEMPDLDALYSRFHDQGLVILAISDEDRAKVAPYLEQHRVSYVVMLDPGRKVSDLFAPDGIPKSFVYDRDGKLVAIANDMRTKGQFLAMLEKAGLR
jgi:peroxiredoxin